MDIMDLAEGENSFLACHGNAKMTGSGSSRKLYLGGQHGYHAQELRSQSTVKWVPVLTMNESSIWRMRQTERCLKCLR